MLKENNPVRVFKLINNIKTSYSTSSLCAREIMKPEKPTIMGMAEFEPSAKCPNCNLIMYLGNKCPHCEHLLSQTEQEAQKVFWRKSRNKGYIRGFIFFVVALYVMFWLFST